jgi:hypothetical protein
MSKRKKMSKAEAGRLGGKTTKKRHGIEHYRAAGRKGFMVTCARHWHGDKAGYVRYLQSLGNLAEIERAFQARPFGPTGIKSIELPPIPEAIEETEWEEDPDPLIAQILRSIRSAPIPEDGGL